MSLDQLQKIRERRLEKQLTEVQIKKEAVEAAEKSLTTARKALEDFHLWRLSQQDSLFQELISQASGLQAMQEYRQKIAHLSVQEEQLQAKVPLAQKMVEQAMQQFVEAKKAANALAMKNEKTKAIVDIQYTSTRKVALNKEMNLDPKDN